MAIYAFSSDKPFIFSHKIKIKPLTTKQKQKEKELYDFLNSHKVIINGETCYVFKKE